MSASLNKVYLMGCATRDVELKYTANQKAFCNFSIAVNDRYKKGEEWVEKVTYVDVSAWGRTAEVAAQYVLKGTPVHVEGRLELDQWEDKNSGEKRSKLKVTIDRLQLLSQKQGGASQSSRPAQRQSAPAKPSHEEATYGEPPSQDGLEEVPW